MELLWDIVNVEARPDHTLWLEFEPVVSSLAVD
jgi:hypothetical protein